MKVYNITSLLDILLILSLFAYAFNSMFLKTIFEVGVLFIIWLELMALLTPKSINVSHKIIIGQAVLCLSLTLLESYIMLASLAMVALLNSTKISHYLR